MLGSNEVKDVCGLGEPAGSHVRGPLSSEHGTYKTVKARISGRGATRAEDAQGTPTPSHLSPSILVYEDKSPATLSSCSILARKRKEGFKRVPMRVMHAAQKPQGKSGPLRAVDLSRHKWPTLTGGAKQHHSRRLQKALSREYSTYKTVKPRFWPWLSG